MKKSISLLFAILVAGFSFAASKYNALTQIELKSQSGATNAVLVVENPNAATEMDSANLATYFEYVENTANVNIYVINNEKYSQLSKQVLSNIPVGVVTNREDASKQTYTLTFNKLEGRNLLLYDVALDSLVEMSNGGKYVFEVNKTNCPSYVAGTNTRIEDRFIIEPVFEFKVCVTFDQIEIYNNPSKDNIVVTDVNGAKVKDIVPAGRIQVISMTDQPAGHYFLTVNGETFEFYNKPEAK